MPSVRRATHGPLRRRIVLVLVAVIVTALGLLAGGSALAGPSASPRPAPSASAASAPTGGGTPSSNPSPNAALPSWPAAPSPQAGLPSVGAPEDGGGNPWGWDLPGTIANAVMAFLTKVATETSGPVFDLLGRTVLATPDLTHQDTVRQLWTGCLVAADTAFVLFIVLAGLQLAARDTFQSRYGVKELLPRLLVAMIAANCSLPVLGEAITVANAVTAAVTHETLEGSVTKQATNQILTQALHADNFLESCLELGVIVLAVAVVLSFLARLAILILLVASSPLWLACLALPQTAGVAKLGCRGLAGMLAIQIAQAITLVALVKVFLTPRSHLVLGIPADKGSLINLLVAATLLWIMCKIPGWVRRLVFRQPLTLLPGRPHLVPRTVSRVVKGLVVAKTLGALGLAGHRTASRAVPRAGTGGPQTARAPRRPAANLSTGRHRTPRAASTGRPAPLGTAGPAAFSHAPIAQTPLPSPTGAASSPVFSHAPVPATSRRPAGPAAAPVFSHASSRQQPTTPPPRPPAPPAFSHAATTPAAPSAASRPTGGPPAPPRFSAAPAQQVAPKRPPAPATPVFSDAPPPVRRRANQPTKRRKESR